MPNKNVITSLVSDIKTEHDKLHKVYGAAFKHWCAVGGLLSQLKENCEHGEFIKTVEAEFTFGINQAQRYMRVHENREVLLNASPEDVFDSLADAIKQIPAPDKPKPKSKAKTPAKPKKRGWKDAVHELVGHLVSREKLQRYADRDGIRGEVEEFLGYEIPAMITDEQAQEIAAAVEMVLPLDKDQIAALKAAADESKAALPKTSKGKVDSAMRQQQKLFDIRVEERMTELLNEHVLPMYKAESERHKKFNAAYKGVMTEKQFKQLVSCLHEDRVEDPTMKAKCTAMLQLVLSIKEQLIGVKKNGNGNGNGESSLPATVAEMLKNRKVKS